ncbi:F0F1 ATP synthase subunit gamma [Thiomicrorhabdus cannonii]|uniref:F0F1 ATP synthase subunit gamma n=1 Tax=Thiomicrorhabdus cannonii TaxID=2748011 RepID=UPI0015BD2082|nr:F0F1 ATP synthase subunit gamma [Thiomicrorhabdus cannonii]
MARYHELNLYRNKLNDIREIMHSMKTLAQMEAHKLSRVIQQQRALKAQIENVAQDFLHFFPTALSADDPVGKTVILVGSERGFCGDFNAKLLKTFNEKFTDDRVQLVAIGNKLQPLVEARANTLTLPGANVTEEIGTLVELVIKTLAEQLQTNTLYAAFHSEKQAQPVVEKLLPAFTEMAPTNQVSRHPPELNLPPDEFMLELTDHALHHALQRIFYVSLMAENQQRIHHLENATQHLDQKTEQLQKRMNVLRQEAIIEEIEVILLNQATLIAPDQTENGDRKASNGS